MSASITLSPAMLREVEQLAEREGRTVSELLQEAVRRYLTLALLFRPSITPLENSFCARK
jgi:predicted transcriptional regulator